MSVPSKKLISKAVTQTPSKTSIDRSLTVNSTRRNISSKIDIDTCFSKPKITLKSNLSNHFNSYKILSSSIHFH